MRRLKLTSALAFFVLVGCPSDDNNPVVGADADQADMPVEDTSVPAPDMGDQPDANAVDIGNDAGVDGGGGDADMSTVATSGDGRSGTRLRRRMLGEGEAAQFLQMWDTTTDQPCFYYEFGGALRCYPDGSMPIVKFADAGCTQPVYVADSCDRGFARSPATQELFEASDVEVAVAGDRYRLDADMNCIAETPAAGDVHFEATPVDLDSFVDGQFVNEVREGGLAVRYIEGEDGSLHFWGTYDITWDTRCNFGIDADDICSPTDTYGIGGIFADDTCDVDAMEYRTDENTDPFIVAVPTYDAAGCPNGREYYTPGIQVATAYTLDSDLNCVEYPMRSNRVYRTIQERIDPSRFGTGTRVVSGTGELRAERFVDSTGAFVGTNLFFIEADDAMCAPNGIAGTAEVACLEDWFVNADATFSDGSCGNPLAEAICGTGTPRQAKSYGSSCAVPRLSAVRDVFAVGAPHAADAYRNFGGMCSVWTNPSSSFYELGASTLADVLRLPLSVE